MFPLHWMLQIQNQVDILMGIGAAPEGVITAFSYVD